MPTLTLINPSKRPSKRRASGKRKVRRTRRVHAKNPLAKVRTRSRVRGAAPARRRRRNPIGGGKITTAKFTAMLVNGAIGGAGAIGMDYVMSMLNRYLPPSMQPNVAQPVGLNDALRAGLTVFLSQALSKPTKGKSMVAGAGALSVQFADVGRKLMVKMSPQTVAGLGYMVPNRVIQGNARISPIPRGGPGIGAYGRQGAPSPLLAAYSRQGAPSPLLAGGRRRQGVAR